MNPELSTRYRRQEILPQIGQAGQQRLANSRVLVVGCGALGCGVIDWLARAGVGELIVVDRDFVEPSNLQRQTLFDQRDALDGTAKAVAAARRIAAVNDQVRVDGRVDDVYAGNVEQLAGVVGASRRVDVIVDGTDNVETRYLLNDVAVKHGIPWVYGGCVGVEGRVMVIEPSRSPCLRCVFPRMPAGHDLATCDTAGVLGPAVGIVSALQATAAIRLLVGSEARASHALLALDAWTSSFRQIDTGDAPDPQCPCCGDRHFELLDRPVQQDAVGLCGRDAVQVRPSARGLRLDLSDFARRWSNAGDVQRTAYYVRCALIEPAGVALTLFEDGRLLVQGTTETSRARAIYARYVGA